MTASTTSASTRHSHSTAAGSPVQAGRQRDRLGNRSDRRRLTLALSLTCFRVIPLLKVGRNGLRGLVTSSVLVILVTATSGDMGGQVLDCQGLTNEEAERSGVI